MYEFMEICQQTIKQATKSQLLFPGTDNKGRKPTTIWQSDLIFPSIYPFRSSQQIEQNTLNIYPVIQTISNQGEHNPFTSSQHNWPKSCIGLILCEHHQKNKIYYVYGTGTLIHNKIVLTSAENIYCRRTHTDYVNVKFITGVKGNKCSGIYDVMRVHYPKEYTKQKRYQQYDFAALELYDDLSNRCGHIGWKADQKIEDKNLSVYGYMIGSKQGSFDLKQIIKQQYDVSSGCGIIVKEGNQQYIVGLISSLGSLNRLSKEIRIMINQWTKIARLYIEFKFLKKSHDMVKYTTKDLRILDLWSTKLYQNECKQFSQANWPYFTEIYLNFNQIGEQGCKYLSQANWKDLTSIALKNNSIGEEGCKYLSKANWKHLTTIDLIQNHIFAKGCEYLSQANWLYLTNLDLRNYVLILQENNSIGAEGCKYLTQANWPHLINVCLMQNKIGAQGCKYLTQTNWIHLDQIILSQNDIDLQAMKYLSQANWKSSIKFSLNYDRIKNEIYKQILKELWPKITF